MSWMSTKIQQYQHQYVMTFYLRPNKTQRTLESLIDVAEQVMSKWVRIPHFGVSVTKQFLKGEIAQLLRDGCEEEIENTWKILSSPNIVALMDKYISGLSKPKKAKSKL